MLTKRETFEKKQNITKKLNANWNFYILNYDIFFFLFDRTTSFTSLELSFFLKDIFSDKQQQNDLSNARKIWPNYILIVRVHGHIVCVVIKNANIRCQCLSLTTEMWKLHINSQEEKVR